LFVVRRGFDESASAVPRVFEWLSTLSEGGAGGAEVFALGVGEDVAG
jgi:hypothetical protein